MLWLLYLLTIISGALNPVQSGLTATLDKALDRPFLVAVAVASLAVSLLCAVAGGLVAGQLGWPSGKAAGAPWWAWLAGLAGFVVFIARPYAAATSWPVWSTASGLPLACPRLSGRPGMFRCRAWTKQFSVTVGTAMEGTHLPLRHWYLAMYLMLSTAKPISSLPPVFVAEG